MNREVYEQYRRDRWFDAIIAILTWLVFLLVGVGIGLAIGYWQWYEATP